MSSDIWKQVGPEACKIVTPGKAGSKAPLDVGGGTALSWRTPRGRGESISPQPWGLRSGSFWTPWSPKNAEQE